MTSTWPFHGLSLTGPELVLRPVRDTDVPRLIQVFPEDFDLDPSFPPLDGVPTAQDRARRLVQRIWRHRGRGFGIHARAIALSFAFESLDARQAITSAVMSNHASLGVSRHLGYRGTGVRSHDTGASIVDLQHLVLTRGEWRHSDARIPSEINGFVTGRHHQPLPARAGILGRTIDSFPLDAIGHVAHWGDAEVTLREILVHCSAFAVRRSARCESMDHRSNSQVHP